MDDDAPESVTELTSSRKFTAEREIDLEIGQATRAAETGPKWRSEALCRDMPAIGEHWDVFFAPTDTPEAARAAALCFKCPVRELCLEAASRGKERYGIRGGLPATIRLGKSQKAMYATSAHDYEVLVKMPNPFDPDNPDFLYKKQRRQPWNPEEEWEDDEP